MIERSVEEWIWSTGTALAEDGFTPANTLAATCTCRDDLCSPVSRAVEQAWGGAFDLNALGGVPTIGRTGLRALLGRPSRYERRTRYVFFLVSHLGEDDWGLGIVSRPGRGTSVACGALAAVLERMRGHVPAERDEVDTEFASLLRWLRASPGEPADLEELTEIAAQVARQRLEEVLMEELDLHRVDFAIVSGILVHRRHGDRIRPRPSISLVDGRRRALD